MKIAILGSRGYPSTYGGYETLVRHVAPMWADTGHDVTVYCRDRSGGRHRWTDGGVECVWTPGYDTKAASTLSFGLTAHAHAAASRFDAVLVLNVANGYFLPILRAAGTSTVVNTDGLEWERGKWGPVARRVFYQGAQMSARHADVLVSDSQAIADVWQTEFSARPRFIPYGADVQRSVGDHRVRAIGFRPRDYVLVVARLIPENNVELTLRALDMIPDRPPTIIVGSATYGSPLETELRALDHHAKLRWLGHVHDQELLTQLWANCGVYVHGHSVGGTNPALLQAMGAGAPTLALDTPFNREVIRYEDQLYPHDPETLAARIGATVLDAARQQAWAERGHRTVASRYRWSDVANDYERALRDAAAKRPWHRLRSGAAAGR